MKKNAISLRGFLGCAFSLMAMSSWATVWDFSSVPEADQTNLNADKTNWTYEESNNRWKNASTFTDVPLTANGIELQFTKGLRLTAVAADQVRVDNKKGSLTLNNKAAMITIPGLKAGDVVTIDAGSSSSSTARHLVPTNLTVTSGFADATARGKNVGTVVADGDVTIQSTGGFYVYSISAGENGAGGDTPGGDTPGGSDHSVSMNPMSNQMSLTTAGNAIKYYNTADLLEVTIDKVDGVVTVTPRVGDWNDTFAKNVTAINFTKAPSSGSEGEITNRGVNITEGKGWHESCYAKWDLFDGATSYNVYVKGASFPEYTRIDRELVRNYGTYGRADMVGLAPGTYSLKVVPVVGGSEDASSASEVTGMNVIAYDRSGFAFHSSAAETPGAYKANGELKDNARVIYVTSETAKTVTLSQEQDKGKITDFTGLQAIIKAYEKGNEHRPLAVRVIGTVKNSDMDALASSSIGFSIKGKSYTPVNVTIEGIGEDAMFHTFGIHMRYVSYVEVRNIGIYNFPEDGISLDTKNSYIWLHNVDMFYGQNKGGDKAKGDGSMDLKDDSQYVTIAYNHFWDSGKSSLCGMKSETGPNYIDYHHNWFDHSDSRHPRVRTMTVHVWNNYYDGVAKYGVGATTGSSVFVENNFYRATKDPMMISLQGTDAKGDGTFSGENGGMIKSFGNLYAEKGSSSNYTVITHIASPTSFDCYEASSRDEQVPSTFKALKGGTTYDNFDTDSKLMYVYTPVDAVEVPSVVTGYYGAGRLNKGDFKYTINYSGADTDYSINKALEDALKAHTSSLKGIF